MGQAPLGRVNIEEAKLSVFDRAVFQNERKELYFNPRAMADFDSVGDPGVAVVYDILSDDEVAIAFTQERGDDVVPFRRPKNNRTGTCSFSSIILLMPELRNVKGKQNRYPYRIDTREDGSKQFVLLVGQGRPTPVANRQRTAKARK